MDNALTCCFTGHRRIETTQLANLNIKLEKLLRDLIEKGYLIFISGGAIGFDLLAAQAVLALKQEFPQIRLHMVLPCKDQSKSWTDAQKNIYNTVLSQSDEVCYTQDFYSAGCMHKRNRFLVQKADCFVAFLSQKKGGTLYTVKQAQKADIPVINLAQELAFSCQLSLLECE